jgi:type I restriction enzyme, S subunit
VTGWNTKRLGDFAESVDYGVTASASEQAIGPKFLRITDIQDGAVNWDNVPWCECDAQSASDAKLKSGDIVFARTGATTGKSFLVRECPNDSVFASYLIRVRFDSKVEPRFVSHFFQTQTYWSQITKSARGVAQPGVNATSLKAVEIPLPPLHEQKRIAEILDRAEALRAKRRAALAQLDTLTQSIFLDLFGDLARNANTTVGDAISGGAILEIQDGNHGEKHPKVEDFAPAGVPFIMANCLGEGNLKLDECYFLEPTWLEKLRIGFAKPGDVLLSHKGTIGETAIVPDSVNDLILSPQVTYYRVNTEKLHPTFVRGFFQTSSFQTILEKGAIQSTRAYIGITRQLQLPMVVPRLDLQHEFARRAAAVENLKTAHRQSLQELDSLFASLQSRAFRGEL